MWFGRLALISYLLSICIIIVALAINSALGLTGNNTVFNSPTVDSVNQLTTISNNAISNQTTNPTFVFGDFFAAAKSIATILTSIPTGGDIGSLVNDLPFANAFYVVLGIRALITFSSAMLIINIISGRDI